ncbi:hypothetical protein V6Z12_A01G152800 [Gossypium hirsutum]
MNYQKQLEQQHSPWRRLIRRHESSIGVVIVPIRPVRRHESSIGVVIVPMITIQDRLFYCKPKYLLKDHKSKLIFNCNGNHTKEPKLIKFIITLQKPKEI